ncbi:MAG: BamA/TamA family outer membrane protein [Myxococcota bacterium]
MRSLRRLRCPRWRGASPWVALVLCALAGPARAHVPEALRGRAVSAVELRGRDARALVPEDVPIAVGDRLNRALLRRAVQALLATGRYADVQLALVPDGAGVRVIARLVPRILLIRVDVVGPDALDEADVRRELGLGAESEVDREALATKAALLRALYAERGYERARIDLLLRDTDDPSRKVLRVVIDEGVPTRVARVRIEGDPIPPASGARSELRARPRTLLDRPALEGGLRDEERTLRDGGWLEASLGPLGLDRREGGVDVVVPSRVGPRYGIQIRGQSPLSRGDVVEELRLGSERLLPSTLPILELRLLDVYRRMGFEDARVTVTRHLGPGPGRATLRVDVATGEQLVVTQRRYPGALHFRRSFLDEQMASYLRDALPEARLLSPVDGQAVDALVGARFEARTPAPPPVVVEPLAVWYASAYDAAVEHVRELYEADGYLDARVGPAQLVRTGPGRAEVVVPVEEGPRAFLHEVRVRGNEALGDREVLEALALGRGEPFSYLALEQGIGRVEQAFRNEGYYFVRVESAARFSDAFACDEADARESALCQRAVVELEVVERFEVRVGEIVVRGAESTDEALVRRVMPVAPGDVLTPDALRDAQGALVSLGVFSGVTVQPEDPDLPARVKPLVVVVGERRTQYLDFRAGLSTAQGARFGVEYGYRNLFGRAIGLTLRAQLGYQFIFIDQVLEDRFTALTLAERLERRVSATFGVPWIGLPKVRASLSFIHQRENERNFGLDKNNVDVTFAWRPLRLFQLSVSADLENNDIQVLGTESYEELLQSATDPRLRNLLRVPQGRSTVVATSTTATIDQRDSAFVPRRGYFVVGTLEYATTVASETIEVAGETERFQSNHLRLLLTSSAYLPLPRGVVFASQLRLGRVVHLDGQSETYPNRQFFLGGVDTLRGYFQDSLVPQDLADEIAQAGEVNTNAVVQGGDVFVVLRGELRFPLIGDVRGGAFVDLGNSWIEASAFEPFRLRPTAGLGLRIATPVGPIALDYGFLLARREFLGEPLGSFHFSIGLF